MSPEQIDSPRDLDPHRGGHRSDIYSFGIVMFEMLTGRLPFGDRQRRDEPLHQIYMMHLTAPAPPMRVLNPTLSPAIEHVVLKCLEKNPDSRPQSCADLLRMLENATASAPVSSEHAETMVENRAGNHAPTVVQRAPHGIPAVEPFVTSGTPRPDETGKATLAKNKVSRGNKLRKLAWLGLGGLLLCVGAAYQVLQSPVATSPDSLARLKKIDWQGVKIGDPDFADCKGYQLCLDRKEQAQKLLAVKGWAKVRYDSPLLEDCMGLRPCIQRMERASRIKAIRDWTQVGSNNPLFTDCMEYEPCVNARPKKPDVKRDPVPPVEQPPIRSKNGADMYNQHEQ
jgi:hypothetical protein